MATSPTFTNILMGGGGARPAVEVYDVNGGQLYRLIDLPPGHSAYAIALAPDPRDVAVVGTKGGRIHLLGLSQADKARRAAPNRDFNQGAPLLSTCFAGPDQVAASDSAGRCMLWRRGDAGTPLRLTLEGHVICSLLQLDDDTLMGLSTTGALLSWSLPGGALAHTLHCPAPPPWSALVRLVRWPHADALAYPGCGGQLVTFDLRTRQVSCVTAHNGDFYAMFMLDEDLVTIGWQDGRLKRWHPDKAVSSPEVPAPAKVISGVAFCDRGPGLLLVRESGAAGTYRLEGCELRAESVLPGRDYRMAVGPSWDLVCAAYARRQADEARDLATRIEASLHRDPAADVTGLHEQLIKLRYEHVSLHLRAQQCRLMEDRIGELRAYRDLVRLLPHNAPASLGPIKRYAALLEEVWQPEEACAVLRSIVAPDREIASEIEQLERLGLALTGRAVVVQSDTDVGTVVAAALELGRPLPGRFLIRELPAVPCHEMKLSAGQIAAKYEHVVRSQPSAGLPPAEVSQVAWVTRRGAEQIDLMTFDGEPTGGVPGLQFGLKVLDAGTQTVVVPVVLLDPLRAEAGGAAGPPSAASGDQRRRVNSWIAPVHRAVERALRMLVTEVLATRRWEER